MGLQRGQIRLDKEKKVHMPWLGKYLHIPRDSLQACIIKGCRHESQESMGSYCCKSKQAKS